ncbi:hypothetical protein [Shewanella sp. FJAT-52076]|uniref:hypothetical protein n=1 Tax=Shewanella sp. FJAT-52076 TaxID=2864202 RepID=UPI001C65B68C|nr:hypothetical protein [Shewanella sp. FJAT-52076]QYJ76127.1 hypothetical protein K0H79_03820 [Shewanella sp. FJAT-52076]
MPRKVVETSIGNTSIKFENTWFSGAKLFVDDELVVKDNSLFSLDKKTPFVSKKIVVDGAVHLIEVFVYALWDVKIKLNLNGKYAAGDKF